jgi:hypothetical protein
MPDYMDKTKMSTKTSYEAPRLIPIGNLHDVVAGSTLALPCDSNAGGTGGGGDTPFVPGNPGQCPE